MREAVISLRPATAHDRFLIRRWLMDPDVMHWWGTPASAEAEVALAMQSPSALCRIIECDGIPVGYAHAVDIGIWSSGLPPELPPGCWDIDIFIGSARHRSQGAGTRALELLTEEVFSTTLAIACCMFASIRNERAVRAYERAGFRWLRIWDDPDSGLSWVLVKDRPVRPAPASTKAGG
jgi:aminoglycoside 6'-N-acetyltransferase